MRYELAGLFSEAPELAKSVEPLQERAAAELDAFVEWLRGRFDTAEPDLPALASGLQDAVAGRHVMLWSRRPRIARVWDAAGAGGEIGPDSLLVGLLMVMPARRPAVTRQPEGRAAC